MNLLDIIERSVPPAPWAEGDNIPWHDPEFSARMLEEHLHEDHDAASRRPDKIDAHVAWIHDTILAGRPSRVLDLCCGPGLYTSRLARLGHTCLGIDYSPASIALAASIANMEGLTCEYIESDVRTADYGAGFDLVMLIYGELNIFRPLDARLILAKAHAALRPGGRLLLEPHPYDAVASDAGKPPLWYASQGGLFSPRPHLYFMEAFWDEGARTSTWRFYVVEAEMAEVTRMAQTFQAYSDEEYATLLRERGFEDVQFLPTFGGGEEDSRFMTIIARRA